MHATVRAIALLCIVLLIRPLTVHGYSVLTHEAIIDSVWKDSIEKVLLKRFPNANADDLLHARAYAYGGCIIQDMGYYPMGSHFFTDLAHYVRSADFVLALLRDAQDVNEYAFALGALAHYVADNTGHPAAINRAVPILYPKVRKKYGDYVTYGDDPASHIKTEFGFDVLQVTRGRYVSHRRITTSLALKSRSPYWNAHFGRHTVLNSTMFSMRWMPRSRVTARA